MADLSFTSALKLFLLLSLLSNNALNFYILSSSGCEPCEERVRLVRSLYPESVFVKYDIAEKDYLERFNEIAEILDEVFLPFPLFGIFFGNNLKLIAAGGLSAESWKAVIEEYVDGVPVYVDDGTGRAELKKIIEDTEKIAMLEALFAGTKMPGPPWDFKSLIIPVSIAAAMDAVNPCAISVFLVLLTFLFYSVERKVVLSTGIAFSGAIFITYLLMGLGLIRAFSSVSQIKYLAVAFAIFLGALSIIEFSTGERRHLPGAFARQITRYLERASNPRTGFVAGVVTASLLLPCSSAPYFLALNLLSEKATLFGGLLLLAIYNLIIIIPFLMITLCVHTLGVKTMDMKLWISGKRRWINLLMGLGLICLSLFILFE